MPLGAWVAAPPKRTVGILPPIWTLLRTVNLDPFYVFSTVNPFDPITALVNPETAPAGKLACSIDSLPITWIEGPPEEDSK